MTNKINICNQALANLGKAAIAALDNSSESARQCARFYDRALATALRDYPWQFARKQESLALLTKTVDGWDYLYAYPAGCVKVRKIYTAENYDLFGGESFDLFNVDGAQAIACNIEQAKAEFTGLVTDPALFDSQFESCLVYALASEVAMPLTGDLKRRQAMLQLYAQAVPSAQASAATERNKQPEYSSRYKRRW